MNKLHLLYDLDDIITTISTKPSLAFRWKEGMTSNTSLVTALKEIPVGKLQKGNFLPTKLRLSRKNTCLRHTTVSTEFTSGRFLSSNSLQPERLQKTL